MQERKGKNMKAINIQWDTDGDKELLSFLPTEMEIPDNVNKEDIEDISDWISNETGYCHFGFEIVD